MPRVQNDQATVVVKFSTTPMVRTLLLRAVSSGLYGKNQAEAAERLVTRALEALLRDGLLPELNTARGEIRRPGTEGRPASGASKLGTIKKLEASK